MLNLDRSSVGEIYAKKSHEGLLYNRSINNRVLVELRSTEFTWSEVDEKGDKLNLVGSS